MKRTKILCLLLAAALCCSCFAGCNRNKNNGGTPPQTDIPADGEETPLATTDIVLANNKTTEYKIVIPADASEAVAFAAQELQSFFKQATSAEIAVVGDGATFSENDKVISVGETSVKQGSGVTAPVFEVTTDGYKIERKGYAVIIAGGDDSGAAYGAYEFLSRQFGYEVYAADEIKIEKAETTYLKDFHITDIPSFEGRMVDGMTQFNSLLAHRMRIRLNDQSDARFDYSASRDWVGGHCHTFYTILPPDKYNDKDKPETYHPEWYTASNGLCLTNESMFAEFVKNCTELLAENPTGAYMNISEEDFMGLCPCATCTAERAMYKTSGWLVRFCNKAIAEIEKWVAENQPGRELKYVTFAYSSGTVTPPVKQDDSGNYTAIDASIVPHGKLYIRFAPINYCFSHALNDASCAVNKTCASDIAGWRAITDRFMIWDYEVNYDNYFMFFNYYDTISANLRLYKDMGVINIIRQSNTGARVSSMDALKLYLNSKLMWNVNRNTESLINDFMQNYYKDGAPYMQEYLRLMRGYLARKDAESGIHFQLYDSYQPALPTSDVWSKRILEQSLDLFEKAYAAYDKMENLEEAQKLKLRVLRESFCVRYLVLKNWGSYYNINSPEYSEVIERFRADMNTLQAFYVKEGGNTSAWLDTLG